MSRCDLQIELDRGEESFRSGDTISGTVRVRAASDVTCSVLTLTMQWRTHGYGNRARGGKQVERLFSGEWEAGQSSAFPFSLTLPDEPPSLSGKLINVGWYLEARADVPWAIDPKTEIEVVVTPGDLPPMPETTGPRQSSGSGGAQVFATLIGAFFMCSSLMFCVFGGGFGLIGLLPMLSGNVGVEGLLFALMPMMFICLPIPFIAIGGWLVYRGVRNRLAQQRLGTVTLSVEEATLRTGDTVSFALTFAPRAEVLFHHITATLIGQEVATSGHGTNRTTRRHAFCTEKQALWENRRVMKGESISLDGTLTIPADAPSSFKANDNMVGWALKMELDVEGWPDWKDEVALVVLRGG